MFKLIPLTFYLIQSIVGFILSPFGGAMVWQVLVTERRLLVLIRVTEEKHRVPREPSTNRANPAQGWFSDLVVHWNHLGRV